jgi:hypothetical protein
MDLMALKVVRANENAAKDSTEASREEKKG